MNNTTNIINKTIIKQLNDETNIKKENKTGFQLDFSNLIVLSGLSIGGILICSCTFYITWECYLKEKIEEIIINWLCCGYGEQFMTFMEWLGFFKDWHKRTEAKKDATEYYGLTPEQIEICKAAKAISKIKYEAALKVRWDELAKHAIRPDDEYHNNLLSRIIKPSIELTEISVKDDTSDEEEKIETGQIDLVEHLKINVSGTPRRRR